ncbi:nucleotide exchange factor GrpE [Aquisediminimonas sediminicola]|uniref:nucleotide exchange factor GrpE n=1 Tax=Alteraquisediminimonas sediminicola TaxID=2676787 RepID=UPI001C8F0722|nr:nucleotide exchange factor GrpE [Aquisediminimonas sediminicola]
MTEQNDTAEPTEGAETAAEAATGNDLNARIAELEAALETAKQDVLYAQADIQNTRRRLEQEKANASAYAATAFARDILSVSDNLVRALECIPAELRDNEKLAPLITGIEMTGKEIENVFSRHGISKIVAVGEKLDPNLHQAMMEMPSDQEPGTVTHEMQAGYMIKDRLLRPALVGVAKAG